MNNVPTTCGPQRAADSMLELVFCLHEEAVTTLQAVQIRAAQLGLPGLLPTAEAKEMSPGDEGIFPTTEKRVCAVRDMLVDIRKYVEQL